MSNAALRYVVLRHEGAGEGAGAPHFDFMFETQPGSMLQTWRLREWPVYSAQEAERIRDHRPAFLTYQGDLGGERGSVTRVDEGTCTIEAEHRRLRIRLNPGSAVLFDQDPGADSWHVRAVGM